MRQLSVINALDHAIARAGKHELDLALHEPDYGHDIPVDKRFQVMTKSNLLRHGVRTWHMPDYHDPLIADAHLLIYHPSHVGLAHALLASRAHQHSNLNLLLGGNTKLHIIDLAAGNLAMQFGAAIYIGQAIEAGQNFTEVRITNIDTSQAMLQAGQDAWIEFVQAVNADPELKPLAMACEIIRPEYFSEPWHLKEQMPGSECWISMMHGIYIENIPDIHRELIHLHDISYPTIVFVTCFGTPENMEYVNASISATPFNHDPYERRVQFIRTGGQSDLPLPWGNNPWRPEDRHVIKVDDVCHRYGVEPEAWRVFWRVPNTAVLSWVRP